jgi:opacity protein-like surface antigen
MIAIAMMLATLTVWTVPAAAQESLGEETSTSARGNIPLLAGDEVDAAVEEPIVLPLSLGFEPLAADDEPASFSMGPEGGYLRAKGADRGTWFGGVKARLHLLRFLAAEASITFHQNRYNNDDVIVTQYPVQLTAFLYIIPVGPIRPYILGGVGWYYTRTDYRDQLSISNSDTTHNYFGEHFGAGAEIMLSPRVSIDADIRYIFINATTNNVVDGDYNYWQITFGLNFYF